MDIRQNAHVSRNDWAWVTAVAKQIKIVGVITNEIIEINPKQNKIHNFKLANKQDLGR